MSAAVQRLLAFTTLVCALQGCTPGAPPAPIQPPHTAFRLTASIQDIMQALVDPSADTLWDAVDTVADKKGRVSHQPKTDEDWKAVRILAIRLAESTNLLALDGRKVVHAGKTLEDTRVAGILKASDIQARIDADHGAFVARASALQFAAEEAIAAIDAKDAEKLVFAGGHIDEACEQCHLAYWYPNQKIPELPTRK